MGRLIKSPTLILPILILVLAAVSASAGDAYRFRGSVGLKAYGYEDDAANSHLWLFQNTNFSLWQNEGPLSFHFSGGYVGDNADDFSHSGRARFLKGYLMFGKYGDKYRFRAGRFFLLQGVGVGVLDGLEASGLLLPNLKASIYAGLMGPMTREFEFEDPAEDFSFGGKLKWKAGKLNYLGYSTFGLSYTNQKRNDNVFRNRIGVTSVHRLNKEWSWMNTLHLRLTESVMRKFVARIKYFSECWSVMLEAGIFVPDVADYSWFGDFGEGSYKRVRFAVDKWLGSHDWGVGFEGGRLMSEETGFRGGPVVSTPYGQAGYRFSSGEHALTSGPWVNVRYQVTPCLKLNAYGAMIDYKWEAFDIEQEDMMMLYAGLEFAPKFLQNIALSAQYQHFSNLQYDSDRRMMGGIKWNFDTGRAGK